MSPYPGDFTAVLFSLLIIIAKLVETVPATKKKLDFTIYPVISKVT